MASPVAAHKATSKTSAQIASAANIDITGGDTKVSTDAFPAIRKLAEELRTIDSRLDFIAQEARSLTERKNELQLQILPDRMAEAGIANFTLSTGESVIVSDIIQASIPSETSIESEKDAIKKGAMIARREAAFLWLRKVKADSLIKVDVSARFGKGEGKLATKCFAFLQKSGAAVVKQESVHPQTLNKFLRESIASGVEVPQEPLALFTGKRASLNKPKK